MNSVAQPARAGGVPRVQPADGDYSVIVSVYGIALAVTCLAWVSYLFSFENKALPFVVVPAIVFLNWLAILPLTSSDPWLRRCMMTGVALKIACASVYLWVSARVWGFSVDAYMYVNYGRRWAEQAATLHAVPLPQAFWGTDLVVFLTGWMEILVGPSWATLLVIYSLLAFWGQYLLYRAFVDSMPDGNRRLAAVLLFLFPSVAFWTAMVGKDALLAFGIGMVAFGVARLSRRLAIEAIVPLVCGTAICFVVRPHVAAIAGVAAFAALLFSRNFGASFGALTRLLAIPLVLGVTMYVGMRVSHEWSVADVQAGIARQQQAQEDTRVGGSGFSQPRSLAARYLASPFLFFRPFIWEARSPQTALSALESLWLLLFTWRRRKTVLNTLRTVRQHALICFAVVFTVEFVLAFAPSVSNFGLLVRQRVMALPFLIYLICGERVQKPGVVHPV